MSTTFNDDVVINALLGVGVTPTGAKVEVIAHAPDVTALKLEGTPAAPTSENGTQPAPTLDVTGTDGQETTGTCERTGGTGSNLVLTAGKGGNAPEGSVNGYGGAVIISGGACGDGEGETPLGPHGLLSTGGPVLLALNGGYVGIGTAEPLYSLHLAHEPEADIVAMAIDNQGSGGGRYLLAAMNDGMPNGLEGGFGIYNDKSSVNALPLALSDEGNLGVGLGFAAAPTRLAVRGTPSHIAARIDGIDNIPLKVERLDPTIDTQTTVLSLVRNSGDPGDDGIGCAIDFECNNAAQEPARCAALAGVLTDTTDDHEIGAMVFSTVHDGGAPTERARITGEGNVGIGTDLPTSKLHVIGGVQVGNPTGGDQGAGTINVAGDIYLNGTAYTNPDYVFRHAFGGIRDTAYSGPVPLDELAASLRANHRLPGIGDQPLGLFGRQDILLEKLEEAHLYILELLERVKALERKGS